MTREEAKRRLLNIERCTPIHTREDARDFEALEMAIQALSQEPSTELEHVTTSMEQALLLEVIDKFLPTECEDAISREELLKAIETWDKFGCDADTKLVRYQDHYVPYIHYDDVIKCIKGMPSVTQKSGKWIDIPFSHYFKCSECDKYQINATNYCPNCGARMESGDKE